MDLTRTSLPPEDNNFSFQPASFLSTFSFSSLKVCVLDFWILVDRPKYWSYWPIFEIPIILAKSRRLCSFVFLLKKIADLSKLTFWPLAIEYEYRTCCSWSISFFVSLQKTNESSANSRYEIVGFNLLTLIPLILYWDCAYRIRLEKPLVININI